MDPERNYNAAVDFLDRNVAAGLGDKLAVVDPERCLTYRELLEGASRVGGLPFGGLHILVNNAGIGLGAASITQMSLEDFRRQQAVNVEGVFLGVKHALPHMRAGGQGGSIINMSSVAGLKGSALLAAYCATKGAVRLFSKAVALECAAAKDGVRVNSVHPGIIETPIWLGIAGAGGPAGVNAPPDLDAMSAMAVPLGVKGLPEDIAQGVLWLASDESRYVTGAELVIDGGLSVR